MTPNTWRLLAIAVLLVNATLAKADATNNLGIFSDQGDIGSTARPGSVNFDPARGEYLITGGGENIWFTNDAFHFVWKKMTGDFTLTADIQFAGTNGNPHRKACLLIRQSLEPGSAYADVAVHGVGLTSLQFRETPAGVTHEIQSSVSAPESVRLERRGDYITMWVQPKDGKLQPGGNLRIPFEGDLYAGLGVCAHDNRTNAQAVFSNVELAPVSTGAGTRLGVESTLETIAVSTGDRRVIYHTTDRIEAPNWSRDGKYFLFNSRNRIYKLPVTGGTPEVLDTGTAIHCNNDHGFSPDGTLFAVSDQSISNTSRIYIVPATGGPARQITPTGPSYWHGWSPDGKTLAFCGQRNKEFDIYTVSAEGGEETRLTTTPGLDDGPEYSPDGKYIYFNSERTGMMQIWRMKPDGSEQTQITSDDYNNWFAHPSPDGRWLVFLSFTKDVKSNDHPANRDVTLRLMPAGGGPIRVLAKLFGGQGTINVPSWSPDSRQIGFVSYQQVYP
jgi:regulation of enolase protein 1 (concanavalin A-like superfamily)